MAPVHRLCIVTTMAEAQRLRFLVVLLLSWTGSHATNSNSGHQFDQLAPVTEPSANLFLLSSRLATLLGASSSHWNSFNQPAFNQTYNSTDFSAALATAATASSYSTDFTAALSDQREVFLRFYSVRVTLIILYTVVFLAIFIGNFLLISALSFNREMLTVTNIFLLNLSIADLCVAFFCVYQNLSLYLLSNWIFGDFLCRMYHFIHACSYTASVCIHVVIAIERYLALVKIFWARVLLTKPRLRLVIVAVWCISAVACSPRLFIYKTIVSFSTNNDGISKETQQEILCIVNVQNQLYNPKIYDVCYIAIFFCGPLVLIGVLYFRISFHLWRSTSSHRLSDSQVTTNSPPPGKHPQKNWKSLKSTTAEHSRDDYFEVECKELNRRTTQSIRHSKSGKTRQLYGRHCSLTGGSLDDQLPVVKCSENETAVMQTLIATSSNSSTTATTTFTSTASSSQLPKERSSTFTLWPLSGNGHANVKIDFFKTRRYSTRNLQIERILSQRRKVIRLMIAIVICFSVFSAPFHLRKLLQHFCPSYDVASDLATMFTLATTLLLYSNSAVNPILILCFSTKIRRLMLAAGRQLLCCHCPPSQMASSPKYRYSVSLRSIPDKSLVKPHTNIASVLTDQEKTNSSWTRVPH